MRAFLLFLLTLAVVAVLSGCDAIDTASVEQQPVAEAYLEAGQPLPPVLLSRTAPLEPASAAQTPISGAQVVLERLDADGAVARTYTYRGVNNTGTYEPEDPETVRPGTTYRLRASLPDGNTLSATTTVPTAIEIIEQENTNVVFQGSAQPSFTVTRSDVAGAPVTFIFTTTSQLNFVAMSDEELRAELTPFYDDGFDPDEDDIEDFKVNPSPILNEANYDDNGDGTITIDLPWIAVAFYGENEVAVSVLDAALYDYIRTEGAQQGGLSPGEIPNVIDNVDGGTGIVGSYARVSSQVSIRRR
jgi:hypothetical protein